MPLHELVYVSLADHHLSSAELTALHQQAVALNSEQGITGLLIYREREFLQLIEGERDAVLDLFGRIERDPRHQQVDRIWDGPITERSFGQWAMGFAEPSDPVLRTLPEGRQLLEEGLMLTGRSSSGRCLLLRIRDQMLSALA